jgi:Zinc carboxypeptidase
MGSRLRVLAVPALLGLLVAEASAATAPRRVPAQNSAAVAAVVPAPREVLGFNPGDDRKLADWSRIVGYFERLDTASARVSVLRLGLSTEQRPFIVAVISSEENINNLDRIREAQRKLADPRLLLGAEEREQLIRSTPAIVAITCSIHSTEIVAAQMSMELAYRLAADNSPETAQILRNTVLLLLPSVNPDGIDIVTDWYRKTLGTKYEGTSPPELYHHYAGHDDNRDWFMLTQVETQLVSKLFWREWFPEIVYDVHQQGQYGSRMCVPPFFDPQNPNIDPVILREVGSIGMRMATRLAGAGFKGIVTNSTYDTWWHGGLRTAPYYHNAVGILTEAASAKIATPIEVKREQLRSPTRGLQNPLVAQTNFPSVWEGGSWAPSDIRDMELITTRTALEEASLHREELIRNFVEAGERAIEAGKTGGPYAYVLYGDSTDCRTTDRLLSILIQQGVEVDRASRNFTADHKNYAAGTYVILLAQPYRANIKCLFESQTYPDRRLYPSGPAEPPYDVAGWTLPMQMGVEYVEVTEPFETELSRVERFNCADGGMAEFEPVQRREVSYSWFSAEMNNSYAYLNALARSHKGLKLYRLNHPLVFKDRTYSAGDFVIREDVPYEAKSKPWNRAAARRRMNEDLKLNRELGVWQFKFGSELDLPLFKSSIMPFQIPRVALYRSWVPSMDEGWTRWVLEQFKFEYANVRDDDIRKGNLNDRFDVVILPDQSMKQIVEGNKTGSYPDEYTGGITDAGVANLRSFVQAGGVLICLNSSSELALDRFGLPVKNVLGGLRRDQFYAPGSIFRATVDTSNPIGYGMPEQADLYFVSGSRGRPDAEPNPGGTTADSRASSSESNRAAAVSPSDESSDSAHRADAIPLVSAWAFEITDPKRARSVARYVDDNPLRSGWLLGPQFVAGKSALVEVDVGKGRVVLFGFRTQHRGQTWGTFKLLFNAILLGGK